MKLAMKTIDVKPSIQIIIRRKHQIQRKKIRVQASKKNKSKSKRYKCDQCDYANAHQSRVNAHRQVHSLEKPFKCEVRHDHFKYHDYLKTHMKKKKKKKHDIILLEITIKKVGKLAH